jgi:SNF2 family DNA or RNA helicase
VLTPSSARYHWESEFQQWLGIGSSINKDVEGDLDSDVEGEKGENDDLNDASFKDFASVEKRSMDLLEDSQIHVLTSSKEELIPNESTQVVICSYGLAPLLITSGKLRPGLFRCAIVDESHMLKNINTKRTRALVPVLHATNRCVLLSGTPALARPSELFPQLKILSTESTAWWDNEEEFQNKYVRRSSPARRAELYTMLTGTVMIRRLKNNILKSMPQKIREKSVTNLSTPEQRKEFQECMALLREGKGVMGKLARQHSALDKIDDTAISLSSGINQQEHQNIIANDKQKNEQVGSELINEYQQRVNEKMHTLQHSIATTAHQFHPRELEDLINQQKYEMQREALVWYKERLQELEEEKIPLQNPELTRKSALNRMYTLTAKAKIPLIADMIIRWLSDPTKGKLCVFAHHIFVLDDLIKLVGLSNADGSDKRYIRIDGSTSPKNRQAQIKAFQTDIDVKVAILGITAAGVAVTLTASSTVWFAELFWTPALMIQAEGKLHETKKDALIFFAAMPKPYIP